MSPKPEIGSWLFTALEICFLSRFWAVVGLASSSTSVSSYLSVCIKCKPNWFMFWSLIPKPDIFLESLTDGEFPPKLLSLVIGVSISYFRILFLWLILCGLDARSLAEPYSSDLSVKPYIASEKPSLVKFNSRCWKESGLLPYFWLLRPLIIFGEAIYLTGDLES